MMKLLYVPTGNVFTLPDEEALSIKASDRGNYKILDAGIAEEEEVEHLDEKTVEELITGEKTEEIEIIPYEENEEGKKVLLMPVEQMDKDMLIACGKRLQLKGFGKTCNRDKMVDKLKEYFGEE